jgi:hypothetical protein
MANVPTNAFTGMLCALGGERKWFQSDKLSGREHVRGINIEGEVDEGADGAALEETDAKEEERALGNVLVGGGRHMQQHDEANSGQCGEEATQIVGKVSPSANRRHREGSGQRRVDSNEVLLEAFISTRIKWLQGCN